MTLPPTTALPVALSTTVPLMEVDVVEISPACNTGFRRYCPLPVVTIEEQVLKSRFKSLARGDHKLPTGNLAGRDFNAGLRLARELERVHRAVVQHDAIGGGGPALVAGHQRGRAVVLKDQPDLLIFARLQLRGGAQPGQQALVVGLAEQINLRRFLGQRGGEIGEAGGGIGVGARRLSRSHTCD